MIWHCREQTRITDFLVNFTMDSKQDWQKQFELPLDCLLGDEMNLVAHSDRGTCENTCSAVAWIMEAIIVRNGAQLHLPAMMGWTFLRDPVSSFLAEALALEAAIVAACSLVSTS